MMSILAWVIVGLIAGYLARLVLPGEEPGPRGVIGDLIAGIVGALLGGWIFRSLGFAGVTGVNIGSIVVAFIGAVIFLLIWRAAARGGSTRRPRA